MLTEYKGPANSRELFPHLVGEMIKAVFYDDEGHIVLLLASGAAVAFGSIGGGGPTFWKISPENIHNVVAQQRGSARAALAALSDLPKELLEG